MHKENHCPKCDSEDISVYEGEMFDGVYQEKVECHDCYQLWEQVYELTARFTLPDADGNTKRIDTFKTLCDKEWAHD